METKLINNLLVFFIVGICASCGVKKDMTYHYETYAPLFLYPDIRIRSPRKAEAAG